MGTLDRAVARGQAMLTEEIRRLKVDHVLAGRYWIPGQQDWMRSGKGGARTLVEIIDKVNLCGVWLGGPQP